MRTIVIVSLMHGPFMLFLKTGIIRRAINKKQLAIHLVDLRDFSNNKVVDDSVCGGKGMALKAPIIISAINHAQKTFFKHQPAKVIALSPQGKLLTQPTSTNHEYLLKNDIILLCGYYEGFDDRISHYIDGELSIGNYVLSNGEVAALVVCDVIARLLPNVINQESLLSESFTNSLLDYPVYTKPRIWKNKRVPKVLLSGNHKLVNEWRVKKAIVSTWEKKPELLANHLFSNFEFNYLLSYLSRKYRD